MENEISLVFPNSPFLIDSGVFPPLGILYIASCLETKDIEVKCYDMGIGHTPDMIDTEFVGISLTTAQKKEGFELIDYFKRQGHFVVVGGPHATHERQDCINAGADEVVFGYELKQLFKLFNKQLNHNEFAFFNEFPIPNRHLLPVKDYKYTINGRKATPIMTTRGCMGKCSFCGRIPGYMQLRSAKNVIKEIDQINVEFGFDAFMIFDDVFTSSKSRLKQIADYYSDSKFIFRSFSRTDLISEAVCRDLKRMGMVEVGLGVESGSRAILARNTKGSTPETNHKAVKLLQEHGIRAKTFIIIGLPGETERTINETIEWIEKTQPDDLDISIFKPMPGSDIYMNPEKYDVQFDKDDVFWYKGTPGKYETKVQLKGLSSEKMIEYRNLLEEKYKKWN
ncbi:MAG: radical SAM protein [Patescibacteria group bacterium]